jgi:hypothetical protein
MPHGDKVPEPQGSTSNGLLRRLVTVLIAIAGLTPIGLRDAHALPSFARQTGQQCAACHNGFPELTPYGRLFKLNGYTFTGGQSDLPPLAVMVIPSYTHTQAGQSGGAAPGFGPNNNFALDAVSLFYGGRIAPNIGAFIQSTYDGIGKRFSWDNTDIRYANTTTLMGDELVFGFSLNNNPGVTDVWNSSPAWGYPYQSSGLAPSPAAGTLIEGGLAAEVVGTNVYGYWNRLVYAEVGLYKTLSTRTQTTLGVDPTGSSSIKGVAPYWRLAIEPKWGPNSLEAGVFGLAATLNPGRITGSGTDHAVDFGVDTQYQYLADIHSVSLQGSWITENQTLTASQALGNSINSHDHLRSLHAKATYYYDQTYGATLGYFRVDGSGDANLYGSGSASGSPNSAGFVAELNYLPFNHGGPDFWPWLNVKFGLQYTAYQKFDGGTTNYDGAGHNASDNDTLYLFAWIAF